MSDNFCELCQVEFDMDRDGPLHVHQSRTVFECEVCQAQFASRAECLIHYWDTHGAPLLQRDPGSPIRPPPPSTIQEIETNGGARLGAD